MPAAPSHGLQIAPGTGGAPATPDQKRFNRLVGRIAAARETLAAWQQQIPLYQQAHVKRLEPLRVALRAERRATVLALDALLNEPGWSRADVETLRETVRERAAELIGGDDPAVDTEMRALFEKHGDVDFETAQRESGLAMKDAVEAMTGVDLGDDDGIGSAADLFERLQAQRAAEADAAAAQRAAKRKTAAERRRDTEAAQATQSVRQVYRQLASALHPDRETDPARREAKNGMMQRANRAYDAGDLLGLLELQLETAQIDARHLEGAGTERLKHYNKVLAEQLAGLEREVEAVQWRFQADFGIDVDRTLDPKKLGVLVDQGWRELSAVLEAERHERRRLAQRAQVKAWLKELRRQARRGGLDDDLFF